MILAAFLLQAGATAFAPPEGVAFRVISERVQDGQRQYSMERIVRFAREAGGYRAEVRMVAAGSATIDRSGKLFEAGFGAFAGHVIVFHLDPRGSVLAIDGLQPLWDAFCARVAETAAAQRTLAPAARDTLVQRIAAPLRAMPAERQRELLATLVTALIADDAGEPLGSKPVRVPGSSLFGQQVVLEGSRTAVAREGMVETLTHAAADLALPAEGQSPARSGKIEVETRRRYDPRTGLLASTSETTRTVAGASETLRTTSIRVERAAPDSGSE